MNAEPALVRPCLASDIEPYVALWVARLSIHMSAALNQFNDGIYTEELRTLVGISPPQGTFERKKLLPLLQQRANELSQNLPKRQTRLHYNITLLGDLLELDPIERSILAFIAISNENAYLSDVLDNLRTGTFKAIVRILSITLDCRETLLKRALDPEGTLLGTRVIKLDYQVRGSGGSLSLADNLHNALFSNTGSLERLMSAFLEPAPRPKLAGQAFPHMADETELLLGYLGNVRKQEVGGVNILVYGPPGSGKTQYLLWLAAQLGKPLYQVKAHDEQGRPYSGMERLGFYLISQRFLRNSDVLILFDEIEDVFPDNDMGFGFGFEMPKQSPGKLFINKLLENNRVPAFWVSNVVDQIDKAYLRRFDFSFEMGMPPASVRRTLLRKYLGRMAISEATYAKLAQQQQLSPAQIEKAAKILRVSGQRKQRDSTLLHVIENSMDLLEQEKSSGKLDLGECRYRLDYLNADIALPPLINQLKQTSGVKGAICLYGAPGTGKTALAHYIAREIDVPIVAKRASDILSPYVGETEQRIAQVFRQAEQEKALLLLDEADSFLNERKSARYSWEVTAVNEMLTQMEGFDGLFICSTNLMQRLDEASLRRFTLKIKFDYLRPEQRWQLFLAHVSRLRKSEHASLRSALDQMSNLTPGDFATVRRQAQLLATRLSARDWIERLRHEVRAKRDGGGQPIGFIHDR